MKFHTTDHCIDVCNDLLRGELSAIETYTQAIDKFRGAPETTLLEDFRRDHVTSANRLRENVRDMGGTPSSSSGAWGTWAAAVEGAAQQFGPGLAFKALRKGEEHGEKDYADALKDEDVMSSCKEMIRVEFLPRQQRHISTLRNLSASR
jgi:hypothetical protein